MIFSALIVFVYGAIVAVLSYRAGLTVARDRYSAVPRVLYDAKLDASSYWRVPAAEAPEALHRYIRRRIYS